MSTRAYKLGFTLIEVLVALAIISIALTAVIHTTTQDIKNTAYLQQKILAQWVATDIIHQVQAQLIILPLAPDTLAKHTKLLGQVWPWQAFLQPTPNPKIQEIDITVSGGLPPRVLAHLIGYLYVQ